MGKKKKAVRKPTRTGVSKQFYLAQELANALDSFIESQGELQPSQTAVFSAALKMFLSSKGQWPPASNASGSKGGGK